MPKVKISLLSPFNEYSKENEFGLEFQSDATIKDLIDELIKRLGDGFKKMLYGRDGKLSKESIILRNGKNIFLNSEDPFKDPLIENQEFVFCTLMEMG